ncbi:RING finger and transmembrane domain-containing protein 1 [Pyrenophora tritici-repentis]|uniref:RING finger and transmembrane domain-containing protein n=3 Tax=Pyrenophora tritici-repentis TaxID=45151 RepID=A0A2W1H443_9PLEO|nr:uncharacterized protein PTRG_03560 [Pyrenophora tritici-repentis Pt-1C-BFP]KAG9384555.1 RING finger and transmembrane domain-containing protein 1 [Pyrenophora tritici-repentis]EDU46398.1 predicted protein [Pyrenophora tritici-repentis Pt-1C-BFP]KAI1516871.1 RING finger and transmembrane domain-containing protein [Pyrenophora tritici-repentis]KAI1670568.1 RING finger and transmembrane domain-containing protein [Pyrenophora tritici-repentis]KAI1682192.1 RING finger and transmembrane domain-co
MSTQAGLPSHAEYIKSLIPVAICSAAGSCPICQLEYEEGHSPILLRDCGHIFGKPCILRWFEEGANTCPLDRKTLFASHMDHEQDGSSSLVPLGSTQNQDIDLGSDSRRPNRRLRRVRHSYAQYRCLYFGGEIIGVNGRLTSPGCRLVVRDLWYYAELLAQRIQFHPDDLCFCSVSEDDIIRLIEDALPRGVDPDGNEHIRPLLSSIARTMLSSQEEAWSEGRGATIQREDLERWSGSLWEVCGGYDED